MQKLGYFMQKQKLESITHQYKMIIN
jgi:hypothetical protein